MKRALPLCKLLNVNFYGARYVAQPSGHCVWLSQLANACILRAGCTVQIFRGAFLGGVMLPSLREMPNDDMVKILTWDSRPWR